MQSYPVRLTFLILFGYAILFSGCASLPPRPDLAHEPALAPAVSGPVAMLGDRFRKTNGVEASGFHLLIDAREALDARLALIDSATSAIDLQYFIWKGDAVGVLLFDRLLQAADRGVRVRIIVDDIWLGATTKNLAALNAHPNLEIRIFNPNPGRDTTIGGLLNYLASFQALNQRMHNKLMIVDNHAIIAGGRNLGNEYFGLGKKFNFLDVDVIAVGGVVEESSDAYDHYWNDISVYPLTRWIDELPDNTLEEVRAEVAERVEKYRSQLTAYSLQPRNWQNWLAMLEENLLIGEAHFLQDDPVQIEGESYRLIDMISYFADPTREEFLLTSPYLIPVGTALQDFEKMINQGVRGKIITNSLASTNHTLVNSHYKKYRKPILATGTRLFEFRHQPSGTVRNWADVEPVRAPFISLHAKTIVSDRRLCFIGSLNFDPRAIVINSENGLLIDSVELAAELADFIDYLTAPVNAYEVTIDKNNRLQWKSSDRTINAQPARGGMQGIVDLLGGLLPIESQL
ncbi:MAG: phospholipase D family protein [Desulfofustis sp.]|nr:phospholipase D family protein [Desulfofustis sp.]NNK14197.1 phospholipase D family protein [Desulfofustis sp.]